MIFRKKLFSRLPAILALMACLALPGVPWAAEREAPVLAGADAAKPKAKAKPVGKEARKKLSPAAKAKPKPRKQAIARKKTRIVANGK
ncbi:MAG: hypothetical protein LBQ62_04940 [Candidatus Accumulibacter sp.]|jgi:hypothetical protein|nr:hypothetical protein [Accumulibacter sp.]